MHFNNKIHKQASVRLALYRLLTLRGTCFIIQGVVGTAHQHFHKSPARLPISHFSPVPINTPILLTIMRSGIEPIYVT